MSIRPWAPEHPDHWIYYYIGRIAACHQDSAVSDHEFRRWMEEMIEDLTDFAHEQFPVDAITQSAAEALGQQMQDFIFHEGPDPLEDEAAPLPPS